MPAGPPAARHGKAGDFSRSELDALVARSQKLGAKGLAYIIITADGIKSPIAKFFKKVL